MVPTIRTALETTLGVRIDVTKGSYEHPSGTVIYEDGVLWVYIDENTDPEHQAAVLKTAENMARQIDEAQAGGPGAAQTTPALVGPPASTRPSARRAAWLTLTAAMAMGVIVVAMPRDLTAPLSQRGQPAGTAVPLTAHPLSPTPGVPPNSPEVGEPTSRPGGPASSGATVSLVLPPLPVASGASVPIVVHRPASTVTTPPPAPAPSAEAAPVDQPRPCGLLCQALDMLATG